MNRILLSRSRAAVHLIAALIPLTSACSKASTECSAQACRGGVTGSGGSPSGAAAQAGTRANGGDTHVELPGTGGFSPHDQSGGTSGDAGSTSAGTANDGGDAAGGTNQTGGAANAGESGEGGAGAASSCVTLTSSCTAECPCATGSTCTNGDQCAGADAVCAASAGPKFGVKGAACVPAHCDNDRQDADETSVDCGGACGCLVEFRLLKGFPRSPDLALANDVTYDGSIIVGAAVDETGQWHATRWLRGESIEKLPVEVPGGLSFALAVNDDGSVVVGRTYPTNDEPAGFRWVQGSQQATLLANELRDVSGDGQISTGGALTQCIGIRCADATVNGTFCSYSGVSRDATVLVGNCSEGPMWWGATTSALPLPDVERPTGQVFATNADGRIVVGWVLSDAGRRAYVWRAQSDGSFIGEGLTDLAGADLDTYAADISADGSVIVGWMTSESGDEPFLWDRSRGSRSLAAELAARGYELPANTVLGRVIAISGDGRTIIGTRTIDERDEDWSIRLK